MSGPQGGDCLVPAECGPDYCEAERRTMTRRDTSARWHPRPLRFKGDYTGHDDRAFGPHPEAPR